jgi:threonine dehydrogenase-like Zn-dependent dehydrogenase
MLAAVTQAPGVMVIDEVAEPGPPGPQHVIIRPEIVGICGSDLHVYSGDIGALSGARSFFPRIQGHEFSAVVEQTGEDCPADVKRGDRVAVWPLQGCGRCYPCRVGRANACVSLVLVGIHRDGGLQQLLSVPASQVFGVGDLDPEPAAFIEPMSIAVHALDRAGIQAGQRVVILGAGPIGLATVIAAGAAGAIWLVRARRESVAALFSHRFPLTAAREAIECVASSPGDAVKVLITLGGSA